MLFKFKTFVLAFTLFTMFSPAWAWAPSHRVRTETGQVYLRPLNAHSVLFAFRPGQSKLLDIENSPAWSPEMVNGLRGKPDLQELELGRALKFDEKTTLYVFRDPVSRKLALEVRQVTEDRRTKVVRLDLEKSNGDFTRVLKIKAPQVDKLFGLGEQLSKLGPGIANGDLRGTVRYSGANPTAWKREKKGIYGNMMVPLEGGNVGNALVNNLLMLDSDGSDFLLFLDNPADTRWDFQQTPWTAGIRHGELQGALSWGREGSELRKEFMTWTGRAPVPPRKAFGMWVSEYGYENWEELEDKLKGLRKHGFPIDGFVLDLQWFGGIKEKSGDSKMGGLNWDLINFPNPAKKIADLALRGIGIIVIEESYISQNLPEFADLAQRNFLITSPEDPKKPHIVNENPWWGVGSMFDYTNPKAAKYWHELKREPLRKMGIIGHWTDLGEPEIFRHKTKNSQGEDVLTTPTYFGGKKQLEVNNIFGFRWAESIFKGYGADGHQKGPRPFILARTGTAGIQRFGASLWSGDIGANWESLRSHYLAQSHVAVSGIDYFGSDVGGFYRNAFKGNAEQYSELYTRWFAAGCLTDIPLRPHTMNLGNKYETAPHLVGDVDSNLANLRQRYQLIPYLYTAAHLAWKNGTPIVSGPALSEQGHPQLDESFEHKRIGADLLARLILEAEAETVQVHFPSGDWYDFESAQLMTNSKTRSAEVDAKPNGLLRTPLFAKAGSLIPIGPQTSSESVAERLEMKVFPNTQAGSGLLIEDDGHSEEYRGGVTATTKLSQGAWRGRYGQVTVGARQGKFNGQLPRNREIIIHVANNARDLRAYVHEQEIPMVRKGGFWVVNIGTGPANEEVTVSFR